MFGHDAAVLGRHDSYLQIQVTKSPKQLPKILVKSPLLRVRSAACFLFEHIGELYVHISVQSVTECHFFAVVKTHKAFI